jgi:hypothetical protein
MLPTMASPACAIRTIAPHTEADPAAILLQFLAAFGNMVGPGPHCVVESTRHNLNLFVILVGDSSKARKGTSWRHICRLFSEVDDPWVAHRDAALEQLTAEGNITSQKSQGKGRPSTLWSATGDEDTTPH